MLWPRLNQCRHCRQRRGAWTLREVGAGALRRRRSSSSSRSSGDRREEGGEQTLDRDTLRHNGQGTRDRRMLRCIVWRQEKKKKKRAMMVVTLRVMVRERGGATETETWSLSSGRLSWRRGDAVGGTHSPRDRWNSPSLFLCHLVCTHMCFLLFLSDAWIGRRAQAQGPSPQPALGGQGLLQRCGSVSVCALDRRVR